MRNDARYTMSIPVPIAVQNESWYNSWWNQNPEDETDVGTLSHWDKVEGGGARCMEEMRGASFAGSSPLFLGRERAAVGVDVGPERRSPRYQMMSSSSCCLYRVVYYPVYRRETKARRGDGEYGRYVDQRETVGTSGERDVVYSRQKGGF